MTGKKQPLNVPLTIQQAVDQLIQLGAQPAFPDFQYTPSNPRQVRLIWCGVDLVLSVATRKDGVPVASQMGGSGLVSDISFHSGATELGLTPVEVHLDQMALDVTSRASGMEFSFTDHQGERTHYLKIDGEDNPHYLKGPAVVRPDGTFEHWAFGNRVDCASIGVQLLPNGAFATALDATIFLQHAEQISASSV